MSMVQGAWLCVLAYFLTNTACWLTGLDAWHRPLIVAPLTGLLLGDFHTGVIMGASLESIFMGISAIGGSVPADVNMGGVIAVAYTILTGDDVETGLALAMPIGTLASSLGSIFTPLYASTAPYWEKLAGSGDMKKYQAQNIAFTVIFYNLTACLTIFLCVAYGTTALENFLNSVPAWITRGLGAASCLMIGVGYAILLSMVWDKSIAYFFIVGYVLKVYANFPTLGIALVAAVIAIIYYTIAGRLSGKEQAAPAAGPDTAGNGNQEGFF